MRDDEITILILQVTKMLRHINISFLAHEIFQQNHFFYIAFQIFFTQNVSLDCLNSVKKYKWKPLLIVIFQTECLVCDLDSK